MKNLIKISVLLNVLLVVFGVYYFTNNSKVSPDSISVSPDEVVTDLSKDKIIKSDDIIITNLLSNDMDKIVNVLQEKWDSEWYLFLWIFKYFQETSNVKWFQSVCPIYYTKEKCILLKDFYFEVGNNELLTNQMNEKTKLWLVEIKYWLFNNRKLTVDIIHDLHLNEESKNTLINKLSQLNTKWDNFNKQKCEIFTNKDQIFTSITWWEFISDLCLFSKKLNENK